jgi:PIN domain nuclease of toxin-antitoxin system
VGGRAAHAPSTQGSRAIDNGYGELAITGEHPVAVEGLPAIHRDPFDRLLVAQSIVEGIMLLTTDAMVAQYPAPVRLV